MRRLWIVLMVVAMALVIAVPATAKKPPKPSPDPSSYEVTLSLTGAEGLGTCDEQPLVMTDIDGALLADGNEGTSVPRLVLQAEIPWSRTDPVAVSGDRFEGCHGGSLDGSESDVPSYFLIHQDRTGHLSNILWAFDVYVERGTKGKDKIPAVKEYFRLWGTEDVSFLDNSGNLCSLNPTQTTTCEVSGEFDIWHYYPIEQIGTTDFEFTLTITPKES